jgi:hypothetical protein
MMAGILRSAFAKLSIALASFPAVNGGYDSAQLVSELKALHKKGNKTAGLGKLRLLG